MLVLLKSCELTELYTGDNIQSMAVCFYYIFLLRALVMSLSRGQRVAWQVTSCCLSERIPNCRQSGPGQNRRAQINWQKAGKQFLF